MYQWLMCWLSYERLLVGLESDEISEYCFTNQTLLFRYLEESSELITWFANVHTKSRLPALIIVEDVLTYASQLNVRITAVE